MAREWVFLNREWFLEAVDRCLAADDVDKVRARTRALRERLAEAATAFSEAESLRFRRDILDADLQQILEARTLRRATYYLKRLRRSAVEVRTTALNDINLNRWKEYDEVLTDSLWLIPRRDGSGAHHAGYWGNFVPQIPRQLMWRYTQQGEWVLDTFVGSGTTLIESRRLGRNGLGVELNPETAEHASAVVTQEPNPHDVVTEIVVGDSVTLDYEALLARHGIARVQLVLMHPPYHDIIHFSEDERDLSNVASVDQFVARFGLIVERVTPVLAAGRYLAVVIGDKYVQGEWIPLGFYLMDAVMARGYTLKSVVVKNFEETRAKRKQQALWRYRALAGGFYVFKHEYVLIFRKK